MWVDEGKSVSKGGRMWVDGGGGGVWDRVTYGHRRSKFGCLGRLI